jgi:hypothetical protein
MARRMVMLPALLSAAAALSGCRTVLIESRGSAAASLAFERTLVFVDVPANEGSEKTRRASENDLIRDLPALNGDPSYRFFPPGSIASLDEMKRWAAAEGFDGLLAVWPVRSYARRTNLMEPEAPDLVDFRFRALIFSLKAERDIWVGDFEVRDALPISKNLPAAARTIGRELRRSVWGTEGAD